MTTIIETHPYNVRETIPGETRLLIVGTAPPPRFSNAACGGMRGLDFDFFYGSEDNYMWEFLENIAEEIEQKKLFAEDASSEECCDAARVFLRRYKLWMRDVLQRYQRKAGKGTSASDADIVPPAPTDCTDFRSIISSHSYLNTVAFTSEKAAEWTFQKLGGSELDLYKKALPVWRKIEKNASLEEYVSRKYQQAFLQHRIEEQHINFYILPSPTGRSQMKGLGTKEKQEIYKHVLFTKGSTN
jgi:hypothetical protein